MTDSVTLEWFPKLFKLKIKCSISQILKFILSFWLGAIYIEPLNSIVTFGVSGEGASHSVKTFPLNNASDLGLILNFITKFFLN